MPMTTDQPTTPRPVRITLSASPLSAKTFAPYGDVIEVCDSNQTLSINYGSTTRHHDLATIDTQAEGGRPIVSIFRADACRLAHRVKVMECHPLGSQAFMPLGNQPYLIVVAQAGEFDVHGLSAFIAQAHQGVNYHRGIWHHYCLPLNGAMDFLVIDRGGEGNNCDEYTIPETTMITVV